jgi:acetyltransferase-like isoleucine patch superfamily enzyme
VMLSLADKIRLRRGSVGRISYELRTLFSAIHIRIGIARALARLIPEFALVRLRTGLYKLAGCDIQRGASIQGSIELVGTGDIASKLHIGEGAIIASNVTFGLDAEINIGKNASIGPSCFIHTGTHSIGFGSRRMASHPAGHPVTIGDGAWIGMASIVLPGVTVGAGSVVSAGSVVTDDVPPHTYVSGNPATVREELPFSDR